MIHNWVPNCGKIPKDFPKGILGREGQWDCDVCCGTAKSRGHPKFQSPKGTLGREGTVMSLVGHKSPEDIPNSQGDFGMGRAVGL